MHFLKRDKLEMQLHSNSRPSGWRGSSTTDSNPTKIKMQANATTHNTANTQITDKTQNHRKAMQQHQTQRLHQKKVLRLPSAAPHKPRSSISRDLAVDAHTSTPNV
jgi:hypothetical protein